MKAYISDMIVDAASSAFRGIGYATDAVVPRRTGPPPAISKAVEPPPVIEISLISVVINFNL